MAFNNTNVDILVAGAFAAFTVDVLVFPLDTIKTRLQSPDFKRLFTHASTNSVNRSLFRGLYQGIGSVVIATVPSSGAFFTTYEATKTFLHSANPTLSSGLPLLPTPVVNALASSTGEMVSCFILTPAEVLKQNAQMVRKPPSNTSPGNTKSKIFDGSATVTALRKFNSPAQLWKGYSLLIWRNLPFTAMQFPVFESLRTSIYTYRKSKGLQTGNLLETGLVTALSAGMAGSVASVITTPLDVIKTRIMLSAGGESGQTAMRDVNAHRGDVESLKQTSKASSQGALAIAKEISRSEGARGLFRGGAFRGLWTALGSGLYLGAYECGRRYLEGRRAEGRQGIVFPMSTEPF